MADAQAVLSLVLDTSKLKTATSDIKSVATETTKATSAVTKMETSTKSLGSKLGNIGKTFSSSIASIGTLGATTLNLKRQYEDLGDAQIKVDKTQLKVSKTTEATKVAQDKLNLALKRYGAGSAQAVQASLDLKQAQEAQTLAVTMNGEALEDQQRIQEDFWSSLVPTVTSAGASIISVIKEIGSAKGIGGLASKFSSLGSLGNVGGGLSKVSGLIDSIGNSAEGAGKKAGGLKGNLLGLGATVGIIGAVTFGALELGKAMNTWAAAFSSVKEPVSVLETSIDKTGKATKTFNTVLNETEILTRAGVSPAMVALDSIMGTHMADTLLKNAGYLDENGKQTQKFKDEVAALKTEATGAAPKVKTLGDNTKTAGTEFKNSANTGDAWLLFLARNEEMLKKTGDWDTYNRNLLKAKDALGVDGLQQALDEINKGLVVHNQTIQKVGPAYQAVSGVVEGFGSDIDGLRKKFAELNKETSLKIAFPSADAEIFNQYLMNWGSQVPKIQAVGESIYQMAQKAKDAATAGLQLQGVFNTMTTPLTQLQAMMMRLPAAEQDWVASTQASIAAENQHRSALLSVINAQKFHGASVKDSTQMLELEARAALGDKRAIEQLAAAREKDTKAAIANSRVIGLKIKGYEPGKVTGGPKYVTYRNGKVIGYGPGTAPPQRTPGTGYEIGGGGAYKKVKKKHAASGMHEYLKQDTLIQAHAHERVDIDKPSRMGDFSPTINVFVDGVQRPARYSMGSRK